MTAITIQCKWTPDWTPICTWCQQPPKSNFQCDTEFCISPWTSSFFCITFSATLWWMSHLSYVDIACFHHHGHIFWSQQSATYSLITSWYESTHNSWLPLSKMRSYEVYRRPIWHSTLIQMSLLCWMRAQLKLNSIYTQLQDTLCSKMNIAVNLRSCCMWPWDKSRAWHSMGAWYGLGLRRSHQQ